MVRALSRSEPFPGCRPGQLSVMTWNLLMPSYHDREPGSLDWETVRLPALRRWLWHFALCDVLCFQEVEDVRSLPVLREALEALGFHVVAQQRKKSKEDSAMLNVTAFRSCRLNLSWARHGNRSLITGLGLPDGRAVGVANVHLEARSRLGNSAGQRLSQVGAALRQLQERKPWCVVVCGDFNEQLEPGAPLHQKLLQAGLAPATGTEPTFGGFGMVSTLDYIWAGPGLCLRGMLGGNAAVVAGGLPTQDEPSDHLPVASLFAVGTGSVPPWPLVEAPTAVRSVVREMWAEVLWQASLVKVKEQKFMERAFLRTLEAEEAELLKKWRAEAVAAARLLTEAVTAVAVARVDKVCAGLCAGGAQAAGPRVFDPGGSRIAGA
eukprot:gb/GFBE01077021.1/.p1 GENE.gb/GFBE01077021.1/~~gb/GFBE01077021.1/.p1  ORF type:complete len:379 (+),score=67.96 gb/GFBE01077021.1/:1-1137(+)